MQLYSDISYVLLLLINYISLMNLAIFSRTIIGSGHLLQAYFFVILRLYKSIFSRATPVPLATHNKASSATWQGTPVI